MAVKPENNPSLLGTIQGEVSAEASPFLQFLIDKARLIAAAVVLFIVAIVGYGFYSSSQKSAKAEQELEFGRLVTGKTGAGRIAALEEYIKTAPAELRGAAWFAIAEAAQQEKDWAKSYAAWEQVAKLDDSIRVTATLAMAQALVEQNKENEALDLLDSISGKLGPYDMINVHGRIAVLAENMGKYDRAIAACEAIIANPEAGDNSFWTQKIAVLRQKAAQEQPAAS